MSAPAETPSPEFVIWTQGYSENVGGVIALHLLCDRLNRLGASAALWPATKPHLPLVSYAGWKSLLGYLLKGKKWKFDLGPFNNPIARKRDLADAIVIYPEIVSGNALRARKVVRWLLHKPGFHTGEVNFSEGELFFYYNKSFDDETINKHADNYLRVTYIHPAYQQVNFGDRSGSCYIVRKGKDRLLDQHPADAIPVDNLSHEEKARVFNQTRFLYSYDLYTFYSVYAALCGCVPIIIPDEGMSEEEWEPLPERRLGLAYGVARAEWAEASRGALQDLVAQSRKVEDALVEEFIAKCRRHFKSDSA